MELCPRCDRKWFKYTHDTMDQLGPVHSVVYFCWGCGKYEITSDDMNGRLVRSIIVKPEMILAYIKLGELRKADEADRVENSK